MQFNKQKSLVYENKTNIKNINKIRFIMLDFDLTDSFYDDTIIDGKIYNNYFYIQDIFYMMGKDMTNILLKEKLILTDFLIKTYMINKFFIFETIKIFDFNTIKDIKLHDVDNSIIFYPIVSGINIIYIKNNTVSTNTIICENSNESESIEYIKYLKSQKVPIWTL